MEKHRDAEIQLKHEQTVRIQQEDLTVINAHMCKARTQKHETFFFSYLQLRDSLVREQWPASRRVSAAAGEPSERTVSCVTAPEQNASMWSVRSGARMPQAVATRGLSQHP